MSRRQKVAGASVKDRFKGAPQTALDRLRGPQTARNSPSNIEVDQLLDGDARRGCLSSIVLLAD